MKKVFAICVGIFFSLNLIAQKKDLTQQTLEFLNDSFYWNLQKDNEMILIEFGEYNYISHQFVEMSSITKITRLRLKFILKCVDVDKYEFIVKDPSKANGFDYKGSFIATISNGKYTFSNLKYVKRDK